MDPDFTDRLAALIASAPVNLVASGERARVAVHIEESLALAPYLGIEAGQRWLDLGTGGGLPGLPLAALCPQASWTLLDARRKKVKLVGEFAAALGLSNVVAVHGRVEEFAHLAGERGTYDGVVCRAVGSLATIAELARGMVRPGGMIAAVKGPRWGEELVELQRTAAALSLTVAEPVCVANTERPTWLVIMRAAGPPPAGIPRRVGLPGSSPRDKGARPPKHAAP